MTTPNLTNGREHVYAAATRAEHLRHVHHPAAVEEEPDASDPWALLPSEVVCDVCHLTRHKHLPACPTCRLEIQGR